MINLPCKAETLGRSLARRWAAWHPRSSLACISTLQPWALCRWVPLTKPISRSLRHAEKKRLETMQEFLQVKFGFNLLQSNQPQLAAYALADSPVGLMAWMTQLMAPEEVGEHFLTNFLIYWFTGTAASSIRLYYENAHDPGAWAPKANSGVPTAVAVFQDGDIAIRKYGEAGNNIARWTEYPHGGHYAALTVPDVWRNDLREFFRELR